MLTVVREHHRIRKSQQRGSYQPSLPPRSTAGHLPLEQVIGVRIPGGQPNLYSALIGLARLTRVKQRTGSDSRCGMNAGVVVRVSLFANTSHGLPATSIIKCMLWISWNKGIIADDPEGATLSYYFSVFPLLREDCRSL
jgi:hypothetical protein